MKNLIQKLFDNRYVAKMLIPVSIINLMMSYMSVRKEWRIIIDVVNSNNSFFSALATMGFKKPPTGLMLVSRVPFEHGLTLTEINEIAQKTIIGTVLQFVKDEELLGVVTVDCDIDRKHVIVSLQPATTKIFLGDMFDFLISILTTSIISILLYFLTIYFLTIYFL